MYGQERRLEGGRRGRGRGEGMEGVLGGLGIGLDPLSPDPESPPDQEF